MAWASLPLSCGSCYRQKIRLGPGACGLHSGEMSLELTGMSNSRAVGLGRIGKVSKQRLGMQPSRCLESLWLPGMTPWLFSSAGQ